MKHKAILQKSKSSTSGFTLIELITVISIFFVILTIGIASYDKFIIRKQLEAAAASLYSDLNQARALTLKLNKPIYITFKNGLTWCYGLNDGVSTCDCVDATSCQVEGQNRRVTSSDYKGLTLTTSMGGVLFSEGNQYNLLDPRRGLPQNSVILTFQNSNNDSISIVVRKTGRINLCSDSFDDYAGC